MYGVFGAKKGETEVSPKGKELITAFQTVWHDKIFDVWILESNNELKNKEIPYIAGNLENH
jgi:hypothetical protein